MSIDASTFSTSLEFVLSLDIFLIPSIVTPKAPPVFQQVSVAITFQYQEEVDMIHKMCASLVPSHIDDEFSYTQRGMLVTLTEKLSEALHEG